MDVRLRDAIMEFEGAWGRYRAFTLGLLNREGPLGEVDLARLKAAVNQITDARAKLDRDLGI
jgi:hypothetical protein